MTPQKKKKLIERLVILVIAAGVLTMLVFFLKDIFFPFIELEIQGNKEGASALLQENKWLGFITVALVEALQMVVIFIPAEFIQLSSGMAYTVNWYDFWIPIVLCDIGVIIGSSIIYFLVHFFKFEGDVLNSGAKIQKYEKLSSSNNTMILMYILFIMPIIPFGAICYYASSKKIPYWKYVLTCATGVIPSICTSIFMGTAITLAMSNNFPIWALVLVIIGAAGVLLLLLLFVLHKFFFKQFDGTPTSVFYTWVYGTAYKFLRLKFRFKSNAKAQLDSIDGPYILLSNHHSYLDPFAIYAIDRRRRYAFVYNKYYSRIPLFGKWLSRSGQIPKKMFATDYNCINNIKKTIENGYPVVIFPEGRLSTDGSTSYIDKGVARLISYFKVPIVTMNVKQAYFAKPKWRKKSFRGKVFTEVVNIYNPEDTKDLSIDELYQKIVDDLSFNEFDNVDVKYNRLGLAKGLDNALYMCPKCGELYSNTSKGRTLKCSKCGSSYELTPNYQFKENNDYHNIYEYYQDIKKFERERLDSTSIDVEVDTVIFSSNMRKKRKDKGVFHIDKDKVVYHSTKTDLRFEYETKKMEGIAYSINEEFEMYYNDELYYFYPHKKNRKVCTRIALYQELIKEREL